MGRFKIPNVLGKTKRPIIPHETPTGQTALFKPGSEIIPGRMPGTIGGGSPRVTTSSPPFKTSPASGSRFAGGDPRAQVMGLARTEELSMKAKLAARTLRAKKARGEATRQTYKNRSEKAMLSGTENNGVVPMPTHGWPVHGPKTQGKAASEAAVRQQFRMDEARAAGQITDREIIKQNKILMRRRKQAGI